VLLTLATDEGLTDQLTCPVRSFDVPLLYVPLTASCRVVPFGKEALDGVTAKLVSVGDPDPELLPPQATSEAIEPIMTIRQMNLASFADIYLPMPPVHLNVCVLGASSEEENISNHRRGNARCDLRHTRLCL